MKKNNNIILLLLGIFLLIAIAVVSIKILDQEKTSKPLSPKQNFVLKSINGDAFTLHTDTKKFVIDGMENKIIFLKVFGWDCKFCMKEVPELIELKETLPEKFAVLAIEAQNSSKALSLEKIKKYGINYPIILGEDQDKFYRYLQEQYGWTGIIPLTIVISTKGDVLAFELGQKSYSLSELFKASLEK
jgi:thiol-disulfide isomerase/thioredoxin